MDMSYHRTRKGSFGGEGKLVMMSFYRATSKPPPSAPTPPIVQHRYSGGPFPAPWNTSSITPVSTTISSTKQRGAASAAAARGGGGGSSVEFIMNQDQLIPQPKQSVSIVLQESLGRSDYANVYGGGGGVAVAGDETVDIKASTYISTVRERFRFS